MTGYGNFICIISNNYMARKERTKIIIIDELAYEKSIKFTQI